MNPNEIPPPTIPPTKDPGIMKDKDKEKHILASYSTPQTNYQAPTSFNNGNSGDLKHSPSIGTYIEQLFKNVNVQQQSNIQSDEFVKKFIKFGIWLFIIFGLILPIGTGIISGINETTTNEESYSPDTTLEVSTDGTYSSNSIAYEYVTDCMHITLPPGSAITQLDTAGCELYFSEGNTRLVSNPELDDDYTYKTQSDYITIATNKDYFPDVQLVETFKVNGYDVIVTEDEATSIVSYCFWIQDDAVINEYGDRSHCLLAEFFIYDAATQTTAREIVESIYLTLPQ